MKKFINLRNVAIMIVCLAASSVFAQSGTTGPLTWNLNNGTLTISGTGDMPDYYVAGMPWYPYRESIHTIIMETGVTSIGSCAFYYHIKLTSVTIPNSVTSIGDLAFSICHDLPSITIPYGVTTIGSHAFEKCFDLTSITLPNSVTSIKTGAFNQCTTLPSITIPKSVMNMEARMFYQCYNLTSIDVDSESNYFASENGVLFNKNKTTLICCPCTKIGEYVIPNGVTTIEHGAFDFSALSSVIFPGSLTTIKNEAFWVCNNLTSLVIPNSVISIWGSAFSGCYNLTTLKLPTNSETIMEHGAFAYCDNLSLVINLNPVPAVIDASVFLGLDRSACTLLVIMESVPAYEAAPIWQDFNIVGIGNDTHYVILQANLSQGGTVVGGGIYDSGEVITVEAMPNDCYTFVGWTENGELVSYENPYTFTVTDNHVLTANFGFETYEIILSLSPQGGVVYGGGTDISCGTAMTVSAVPDPDCEFISWTDEDGNIVSTTLDYTFVVIENRTLTANFDCGTDKYEITLSLNPIDGGELFGGGIYSHGDIVTVSAVPTSEYDFVNWLEDGMEISTGSDYTFTVTSSRALTGNFETYDIVILSSTPDCGVSGGGNYRPGIEITVSANTRSGSYEFVNWTKDGVEVSTDADYTFITPLANLELVANFKETSVGIGEVENDGISVYPNPTTGILYVETRLIVSLQDIEIFDMLGRMVKTRFIASLQDDTTTIDLSDLPTGMYFIRIQTENGIVTKRIVKQ